MNYVSHLQTTETEKTKIVRKKLFSLNFRIGSDFASDLKLLDVLKPSFDNARSSFSQGRNLQLELRESWPLSFSRQFRSKKQKKKKCQKLILRAKHTFDKLFRLT